MSMIQVVSSEREKPRVWKNEKYVVKVEKVLKDSLDLIPSPSPSVKIQIMDGKVSLRCKGKTLLALSTNI